ncbi:unnamed protein product, partial [Linum tenue]
FASRRNQERRRGGLDFVRREVSRVKSRLLFWRDFHSLFSRFSFSSSVLLDQLVSCQRPFLTKK